MIKRIVHTALTLTLLTCFLFVSSAFTVQAANHSTHHAAHHQAATHSDSLCSWMCAAGHVLQTIDFELRKPSLTSIDLDITIPSSRKIVLSRYTQSRAPPHCAPVVSFS